MYTYILEKKDKYISFVNFHRTKKLTRKKTKHIKAQPPTFRVSSVFELLLILKYSE